MTRSNQLVLCAMLLLLALPPPAPAAGADLVVSPEQAGISCFFSGLQVEMTGDLPPGSQAVVEIIGQEVEEELMRKARHWDLWMNGGEVDIGHVPRLYVALSSDQDLLSPGERERPWGYLAFEKTATFSGQLEPSEDLAVFREFVDLMEREKLYRLQPGGLRITHPAPNRWQMHGSTHLPSKIRPGTYRVVLSIVQNGKVVAQRFSSFRVELKGIPAFLSSLAREHGAVYGFLAMFLAMAVGMLTGLVFNRRG